MGRLLRRADGAVVLLAARTLVGREPHCLIRSEHLRVSREHAVLAWGGGRWTLRDLGSRNGSALSGQRLSPQEERGLRRGDTLCFGHPEAGEWELDDDGPPTAFALPVGEGAPAVATGDLLFLPNAEAPVATLFRTALGQWMMEQDDALRPLSDGDLVEAGGAFRLFLPEGSRTTVGATEEPVALGTARLRFTISRDQEHVSLAVLQGDRALDLGERQHWFVLWVLAIERQQDRDAPAHDQGWADTDRLARRTGIEKKHLDTYISRARRDLAQAGVEQAAQVVMARPGQRRLGMDPRQVEIINVS